MTVWLVCLTIGMACYYVVVGLLLREFESLPDYQKYCSFTLTYLCLGCNYVVWRMVFYAQ